MTSLVHSNDTDNVLVCICCTSQSDILVKYSACKHTGFLLNFLKSEIECKSMYICNICHNMLKKIEVFRQQVEESMALLLNQLPILKINKLHDFQRSPIQMDEVMEERRLEIEIKVEPEYMEVEPEVKFEIDSSDNDTEPAAEVKKVKKEKKEKKKKINIDSSMPRSAVPSYAQVEMLLESLEENNWLATGYARTTHARDRTRKAWQKIAMKLKNRDGCNKNWQQWAKYWKDKKSAVKKKASQIRMARQQKGGGVLEEGLHLSAIEEKIVQIMGGGRVSGDRELEIELIHEPSANEPGSSINLTLDAPDAIHDLSDAVIVTIQDIPEEANATQVSESILQDLQPGSSCRCDNMRMDQLNTEQEFKARSPPAVPHKSNPSIASSSARRRRLLTARRRRIQNSPPLQRQSQMASLTKRFLAIEERRLDNQQQRIDNQRRMIDVFKEIAESWSRQTQALHDLCVSLRVP